MLPCVDRTQAESLAQHSLGPMALGVITGTLYCGLKVHSTHTIWGELSVRYQLILNAVTQGLGPWAMIGWAFSPSVNSC